MPTIKFDEEINKHFSNRNYTDFKKAAQDTQKVLNDIYFPEQDKSPYPKNFAPSSIAYVMRKFMELGNSLPKVDLDPNGNSEEYAEFIENKIGDMLGLSGLTREYRQMYTELISYGKGCLKFTKSKGFPEVRYVPILNLIVPDGAKHLTECDWVMEREDMSEYTLQARYPELYKRYKEDKYSFEAAHIMDMNSGIDNSDKVAFFHYYNRKTTEYKMLDANGTPHIELGTDMVSSVFPEWRGERHFPYFAFSSSDMFKGFYTSSPIRQILTVSRILAQAMKGAFYGLWGASDPTHFVLTDDPDQVRKRILEAHKRKTQGLNSVAFLPSDTSLELRQATPDNYSQDIERLWGLILEFMGQILGFNFRQGAETSQTLGEADQKIIMENTAIVNINKINEFEFERFYGCYMHFIEKHAPNKWLKLFKGNFDMSGEQIPFTPVIAKELIKSVRQSVKVKVTPSIENSKTLKSNELVSVLQQLTPEKMNDPVIGPALQYILKLKGFPMDITKKQETEQAQQQVSGATRGLGVMPTEMIGDQMGKGVANLSRTQFGAEGVPVTQELE